MPAFLHIFLCAAIVTLAIEVTLITALVVVTYGFQLRHGASLRVVLRALPYELFAHSSMFATWPWFLLLGRRYGKKPRPGAFAKSAPVPVVLLHGYQESRMVFWWLGRALARRGRAPLIAVSYWSFGPARRSAESLGRSIERICAAYGAPQVDVVAHSLGGLVTRYYAEKQGGAARIRRIVTLGTPHQGTHLARYAFGPSTHDLLPGSAFLEELGTRAGAAVPIVSIYSLVDNLVLPSTSSHLEGAERELVFEDLGHNAMLLSPRVADAIARALSAPIARSLDRPSAKAAESYHAAV